MENYILLYGDKKPEDNICIKNMFKNSEQINLGWSDFDYKHNVKIIEKYINNNVNQIIFAGLEVGWDKLIIDIKKRYHKIKIKVICNTLDSLLYYEYERENFFKLLQLSKEGLIHDIAFLRKGQYETYNSLGYKCSYLRENFILDKSKLRNIKEKNQIIDIGIYPLNYTWDKNIFNQLCIPKMIENSNLNYNKIDERMQDFIGTMGIKAKEDTIENIDERCILEKVVKNDINVACSFTDYFHPLFFISMEQGIPCIVGNTMDCFDKCEELKKYIVTLAEDNAITNANLIDKCLKDKIKVMELYKRWKEEYNKLAEESIQDFLK